MNHEELKGKIMDFDDGELSAAEKAELETHLSGCASCRASLDSWRAAKRAFFSPKRPSRAETERFVRAVMDRVERPAFSFKSLLAPACGLAFAAAAVALAYPRASSDPFDALLEGDSGLYAFVSQPAPSTPDDALAFVAEDR
jgi:anti-sigma factor RsiW